MPQVDPPRFGVPCALNPPLIGTFVEGSHHLHQLLLHRVSCSPCIPHGAPVHNPFILYFAAAKCPADSYSLKRNKRYLNSSSPLSPSLSLSPFSPCSAPPSLSLFLLISEESRARGCEEVPATWPTTPLRSSLRSLADELPGLFFLREPLPALSLSFSFANFVFLSCLFLHLPRPPSRSLRSRFFPYPFFLSFSPFLVAPIPEPSHGIMQHITEKSKQARRNSPGSDSVGLARTGPPLLCRRRVL